jgi:hypothetical protein
MNARLILVTPAAVLLAATVTFAQSGTTSSSSPRAAWSASTSQLPTAVAPRPARATAVAPDLEQQAPTAQAGTAQPPATTAPTAPRMMPRPQRGQLINVKVEFTITDQIGTKPPIKKTVAMVVADGESSRIRSTVEFRYPVSVKNDKGELIKTTNSGNAPLSVDVSPAVEGNKVRLDFSVEYSATDFQEDGSVSSKTTVSERLAAILDSGIPLIVAQSSDAYSDRKVTVEIKATILK